MEHNISIVIPVYNEEGNLHELYKRLKKVLEDELSVSYEIIFVNDGSRDNSWNLIQRIHSENKNVKGIKFSRNFGHHVAVTAGLDHCDGDAVVLMDGDLQDLPEDIPKLYEKLKDGYDIVYAIRSTRGDKFFKKLSSKLFLWLFRTLSNVEIPPDTGIFRIMDRRVVGNFKKCREKSRFITALMSWSGFSSIGVETDRDARYSGKTKYNFFRSLKLAMDGIISFSYFPLRLATYVGFFTALIGIIVGIYMIIRKLFYGIQVQGYTSIILTILCIGGVQLVIIGLMGEYIGRIFSEVQNRPMYVINEKLGVE